MNVKELRKALKAFDDELEVKVANIDTLGDDYWEVKDLFQAADSYSLAGYKPATVVLTGTD